MTNIERTNTDPTPQPRIYGVGFCVDGDSRFLSHHDSMRLMELTSFRAKLPVAFSGGFNPRPKISLSLPRPVAMASRDELMVIRLTEALEEGEFLEKLNSQCPPGIRFTWADELASAKLTIISAMHEAQLTAEQSSDFAAAIDTLDARQQWLMQRKKQRKSVELDIKPMITHLSIQEDKLIFELSDNDGRWAKPAEVFELLGANGRIMTAKTTRTAVKREIKRIETAETV